MYVITIGRSRNNQIVVADPSGRVSRNHAEIRIKADGSMVIVDNSANGTWVNGHPIPRNREFYIYKGDQILFAGKALLDWQKVLQRANYQEGSGRLSNFATKLRTNIARDVRNLLDSVIQIKQHVQYFRLFFDFLSKGASDRMVAMSIQPDSVAASPSTFFSLGLGVFVFCLLTFLKELLPIEGSIGKNLSVFLDAKHMDFIAGFFLLIYLTVATFLWAYLNYKSFQLFSRAKRRWREYFRLHFIYAGIFFLGTGLVLMPGMLILFFTLGRTFSEIQLCIILSTTLWFVLSALLGTLFIRINVRFWEESFISSLSIITFTSLPYLVLNLSFLYFFISFCISK